MKFLVIYKISKLRISSLVICLVTMFIHDCIFIVFLVIAEIYSLFASFIPMFEYVILWGVKIHCGNLGLLFTLSRYFLCLEVSSGQEGLGFYYSVFWVVFYSPEPLPSFYFLRYYLHCLASASLL